MWYKVPRRCNDIDKNIAWFYYEEKEPFMKHVLMRLQEYQKQASASEKNIIDFLLGEMEEASELSVHELARKSFTSPSTVIRLCKKIGFRGYKEFRKAFLYEVAIRKESGLKQI